MKTLLMIYLGTCLWALILVPIFPDLGHLQRRFSDLGLNRRTMVMVGYCMAVLLAGAWLLTLIRQDNLTMRLLLGSLLLLFSSGLCLHSERLGRIFAGLERNWTKACQARAEKRCFDHLELKLCQATSFDAWWETMCEMAGHMDFYNVELWKHENNAYSVTRSDNLRSTALSEVNPVKVSLLFGGNGQPEWEMRALLEPSGNLEECGRRVMLLARLLDKFVPPTNDKEDQELLTFQTGGSIQGYSQRQIFK